MYTDAETTHTASTFNPLTSGRFMEENMSVFVGVCVSVFLLSVYAGGFLYLKAKLQFLSKTLKKKNNNNSPNFSVPYLQKSTNNDLRRKDNSPGRLKKMLIFPAFHGNGTL